METYPRHVLYFSRKFYLRQFDLFPKNQNFDPSRFDPIQKIWYVDPRTKSDFRSRSFDLFPPTHLNKLGKAPKHRLRSRVKSTFRPEWRWAAVQRFESLKENLDPSEYIRMGRDERARQEYFRQMPEDSMHRRATNGRPLKRSVNRSRKEEPLLYRLGANRETSLMETRHRFGISPTSPVLTAD